MGNIQCNSDKIKITFDMLEQFFKGNNSEFETRINFDYFSIKNLNNINNCKVSKEFKNISNYIPIEKKKENFIKWIKLIGQSSFEEIKKSKNIEYEIESKLSKLYRDKNKKFIQYFLNGPPESIRPIIWIIVSNKIPLERDDKYYKDLLNNKIENNILEQIDKDINRTFYENEGTKEKKNILYNLLYCLPSLDEDIGYCQGLNFITSFILKITFFNELDCFYLLTYILEKIRGYYIQNFPLLKVNIYIFNHFFIKLYPKLYVHFKNLEIPNEIWVGKWFQTLFTINLPYNELCRIWDCFFIFGLDFIIPISLSLIYYMEKDLLKFKDSTEIVYYFKECLNTNNFEIIHKDIEKRIITIDKIISKAKQIFKLMNKNYINDIKKEFAKENNMNLEILEKIYDLDLISDSNFNSSSTDFSSIKKNILFDTDLKKKSVIVPQLEYFSFSESFDIDEENDINNNREKIPNHIFEIRFKHD